MAPESSAAASSISSPAASSKRARDPGDEVYVDNLNSHKRYLTYGDEIVLHIENETKKICEAIRVANFKIITIYEGYDFEFEWVGDSLSDNLMDISCSFTINSIWRIHMIMASSLNGLTVGDSLSDNLIDCPVRSESMMPYLRDESSVQYSPMSEDSDDSRYYESSTNTCSSQPESAPTSPVSPYRSQKPLSTFVSGPSTTSYPSHGSLSSSTSSQQPRQRGSDTEGRFPSSPSDICHSADLRKAALLRSVQMRAHPLGSELQLSPGQESGIPVEVEERPCLYMKLDVDEGGYQIGECSALSVSESETEEKSCGKLGMDSKGDEFSGE